jgi:tetratricopeptide (TPR) repeat protein
MPAEYDVFLSHAWVDGDHPSELAEALEAAGLRVWFDAHEIADFDGITRAVQRGLAKSKALLAYYSKTYPTRRACQWELTAAFLAAQHEGDPRRRVLAVNPEAGAGHIHPVELRDAKSAKAPAAGDRATLGALAQAVRKQVDGLSGPLSDIRPLNSPLWYGMHPVGSTRFVGRLEELWRIHSQLHAADVVQVTGTPAASGGTARVSGLGGIGKSLLAEEYALRFGAAYPGGIFWVRAYGNDDAKVASGAGMGPEDREAEFERQVQDFAGRLGLEVRGKTPAEIEGALAREIEHRGKVCLWVVDDVPGGLDGHALRRWFAPHPLARTLLTTRSREYGAQAAGIDLSVLPPDEAYQLLASRRPPASDAEREKARLLAEDLGRHALAIDVTGAALASFGEAEPYCSFRAELERKDKDALDLAATLADALPNGHEPSIAQTLLRSIRGLGAEGQDFLRLASVLAVAPVPASLVTAVLEGTDNLSHADAQWRQAAAFKQATDASLAEVVGEEADMRLVHTLVSRALRFRDREPNRTKVLRAAAVEALWADIAKAAEDIRLHHCIEFHVAHAREMVATPTTVPDSNLLDWVGRYDLERAAYASARAVYSCELELRRRVLGPEHRDTLTSMSNLAETLRAQGDLPGACKLHEEALDIRRRVLGPEHPDTLTSTNNLSLTLDAQGDLAGARKLQEEALAGRRRVLGPEDPATLRSMGNLASVLSAQGDVAGARKLQEEVLDLHRRLLGFEHRDTLKSMGNLARTLSAQGDLASARKLQEELLDVHRRVLGPEHPDTLTSMSNLANTLHAQGEFAEARRLQEDVLAVGRQVLGREHPDTLTSMINLAETLRAQRDLAGARELQEEVLSVRRRVLGSEHPRTSISAWNLIGTLHQLGERNAAIAILARDLLWLLGRDPSTLGADQRKIREMVAQLERVYRPTGKKQSA